MVTDEIGAGRRPSPLPLTKHEIDRRIQGALAEMLEDGCSAGAAAMAPRRITAADLVRRVAPFLSRN
jgi:hypothetical protein